MSAIKARHTPWAESLFDFYINRLIDKNFFGFFHFGEFPQIRRGERLIVTPNHFSWWDGFFMYRLKHKYLGDRKLHLLMLESQLKKFWFFSRVGAYSIDPANPKKIISTINYTSELLDDPGNFVIIYPQGEIEPLDVAKMNLKKGVTKVIEKSAGTLTILPVAFKIVYGEEMKPAVFSVCGSKIESTLLRTDFGFFESAMNSALRSLDGMNFSDYRNGEKY